MTASASSQPLFEDITAKAGIDFQHQAGGEKFFVPRSIGSGVAIFDCDNDGRLDIYFIQNAGPGSDVNNQLFRQQEDLSFVNVSDGSGLDIDGWGMGCAAGDVNNDGRVDLLITEYGAIRLLLNQSTAGTVKFVDVTSNANLANPSWGTSASFFDYDRDGWLDLIVSNYLDYDPSRRCTDAGGREDFCGPQSFGPLVARIFHNLGAASGNEDANDSLALPRFEDVTVNSGIASATGKGLGVVCADFDGDGWQDVFIANDGVPNTLWVNQRNEQFTDEAGQRGLAYNALGEAEADMGVALGDANADGLFDVFVTHRATETHTLWLQSPQGIFIDQTATSGITRAAWRGTGFGTAMSDIDNDGDLDLVMVNGRVLRFGGELPETPSDVNEFWRAYANETKYS